MTTYQLTPLEQINISGKAGHLLNLKYLVNPLGIAETVVVDTSFSRESCVQHMERNATSAIN